MEHVGGVTCGQHSEYRRVVLRNPRDVQRQLSGYTSLLVDQLNRVANHRERVEVVEVERDQPCALDCGLIELGDQGEAMIDVTRNAFSDGSVRDRDGDARETGKVDPTGLGRESCDVVVAVTLGDVPYGLIATTNADVDVDIRQHRALRVQEPLEQQPVLDRIDVGDVQRPCDQTASAGAAPRPYRDIA